MVWRACSLSLVLLTGISLSVHAEELTLPAGYAPAAAEVGKIVGALSKGKVEAAAELFGSRLPRPPEAPKTPFEPSFLDTFTKAYAAFPRDVDQLELTGWQPLSSTSAYLYFVIESPAGPFMCWCLVQQRPERGYVFQGMSFHHLAHPDPAKMKFLPTELYPILRPSKPISIDLPAPE